ncbi:hypothetical protein QF046_002551 [Microbacterium sp. W4I4]|uniref:hypothetical protein n=1 Tax=Microbacterium sp. W4I4 TaxID=3042295 RepID=UPI002784A19C|nr:hypothetical protein [Microbacterium sp. W4I4]MDQ0614910.1 hypothetical protein [Microbacterium sp. W4I4]
MGNQRRRARGTSVGTRLVSLLIVAVVGFGIWTYNGQPDLFRMAASHLASPATKLMSDTDPTTDPSPGIWSCVWNPTRDDDWHNDVECFDGTTLFRPYLLPDIPRVDEAQMRTAGEEYEAYLNAGGEPDLP